MFASSPASQSRAGKDTPQNNSGEIKEVVMAEPELSNMQGFMLSKKFNMLRALGQVVG